MINNSQFNNHTIKGQNTFNYDDDTQYRHFFVFAQHASYYKKQKNYPIIGEYIIPNEIIEQHGFGFYSNVETMRNDKLYGYYMPIPEIIIKEQDFRKEYLYKLKDWFNDCKKLDKNDNEKYSEPLEEYFHGDPNSTGYLDYSYADVYYEMVYQLAKKYNMDLKEVTNLLKNIDLHEEIKNYYKSNIKFFEKQTKKYVKTRKSK